MRLVGFLFLVMRLDIRVAIFLPAASTGGKVVKLPIVVARFPVDWAKFMRMLTTSAATILCAFALKMA